MLYIMIMISKKKGGGTMKIQIRNVDETTHKAAKILAAHAGVSLNKFLCDAIHAHTLRVAHQRGLTDSGIRAIKKPARS